ncbi:uncharacterized protein Bfra_007187 [Botrytis fragariae]|uniref:Uncharacterized protein n=1 Tax=Botrytis fragariae TaxID=1964551 RepID=A0A8H6ED96_9HELO|nr:uncharacterized protein Bfra_007187 [Botrytis fragariae]KAF5867991.1 hypothetical protein Bfra_007187 [Botrytis fragariae]
MEGDHHSRKRRHAHEHGSGHVDSRKHHKHYNNHSASPRNDRIHSPKGSVEQRPPLAIRDQNELSADKDYVRNWLAQTQNEDIIEPPKQLNTEIDSGRPQKRPRYSGYGHTAHRHGKSRSTVDPRPKSYEEHASSDSSLLEASRMTVVDKRTEIPQKSNTANRGHVKETTRSHKHQRNVSSSITSISSRSSVMQPKQEIFEKRARHKTREDRYDTKRKSNKAEAVDKPIRTRREKRGDRAKAARKASNDLMSNFASNKIGKDRLIVRPSNGPGIFQNGRASSPPRRRGLPDLAFSEMEFLQRSGKNSQVNGSIVVPKIRVKEKKKAARAQDEIAEFFKPSKTPARDNNPTIDHRTSPTSIFEVSLYERQLRRDREDDRYRYYTEDSEVRIDEKRSQLMDSGNQQVQPNELQFPEKLTPKHHSEEISNSKVHSKATDTIMTWSESQHSPGATMALRQAREQCCQRQMSATPDSIRNSIERTGIFKDTGIESSSRRKSNIQEPMNDELHGSGGKDIISTIGSLVETSREFSSLGTDSAISSHETGRPLNSQQSDCLLQLPSQMQKKIEEPLLKWSNPVAVEARDKGLRRTVIEYYDPNRGWYRGEEPGSPSKSPEHHAKPTTALTTTPLTRQQMARNAKIKRPSTTLPVIREASDESREKSHSSISSISGKEIQRTESAPVQPSSGEGDMSKNESPTNDSERLETVVVEPRVSEKMFPQTNSQFQHDKQIRYGGRGENTSNISKRLLSQTEMADEEGKQPPEVRTVNVNGRAFTSLRTTSHINSSSDNLQLSTQPLPRREHENYHGLSRQHFSFTPRSPLIRVPSLYVHQMELEQEEDQITNDISNEKLEEYGFYEVEEPYCGMEGYKGNWDDLETEQGIAYGVEDVLESRRYMGDLRELGPQEANMYQDSISRYELAGLRYNIDFRTNDYQIQDVRRTECNPWDSDNHFFQEPWIENRQDIQEQYEIENHGDQWVGLSFPSYRELDEGQDGNASDNILMQRFWRPNPQY